MTIAQVKNELIKVRILQRKYRTSCDKLRQFRDMISYPAGISYETDGSVKASRDNRSEQMLNRLIAYREECEQYGRDMMMFRERAECMISVLQTECERDVMTRRYIMCQSWEEISALTSYSIRQLYRIHNKSLEKIAKIIR